MNTSHITDHRQWLEYSPEYKDSREFYACIDNANTDWQLITRKPDAWRISWSCNLSTRRRDLIDLGGFDESFTGWGLEDEELGYRFLQNGSDQQVLVLSLFMGGVCGMAEEKLQITGPGGFVYQPGHARQQEHRIQDATQCIQRA